MQNFVYMVLAGSLALAAVGCGPSSFHSRANTANPSPVLKPAGATEVGSAYRFAIDQKEANEAAFNEVIENELKRTGLIYDFKKISVGEFKLDAERKWAFLGNSAVMQISGDVCNEGQTVLQVTEGQNQIDLVTSVASGMVIPFRIGKVRTLLTMPADYENPGSVLARGTPRLQPAEKDSALTSILSAANKDISFNVKVEDRKITLTVLKPTGPSQYLLIQTEFNPTECTGPR